jgi:hypothetical protein
LNKSEVWKLFEKIVYSYPSFTGESEKATAWHEMLAKVPYDLALANLKRYASVPVNKYPPHPGALADRTGQNTEGNYVPNAEETRLLDEQDQMLLTGSGIPESALERMRQLGYKSIR